MGKTIYSKCKEMLEGVDQEILTLDAIQSLILINIGGQAGTIKNAMFVMAQTGLIIDIGNSRFRIVKNE
jgi:hypothetical protein